MSSPTWPSRGKTYYIHRYGAMPGGRGGGGRRMGGGGGLSVTDTLSIGLRHSSSINKGARERGLESVSVCFYLSQCGSVST